MARLAERGTDMAAPWRYAVEYRAVASVAAVVRTLPQWASVGIGALIGSVFYLVDAPHRRLTVANLTAAFPHKSPREVRAIARGVFAHFGSLLTELLRFGGLSPAQMLASVEFEGEDRVTHALAKGKGVLFITGHFGYWELQALAHAVHFPPVAVVVRALDNPRLNAWIEALRTSTGNNVIHRRGALRQILRALTARWASRSSSISTSRRRDAVVVDFFNRPAATTSAVAALALRTGAPIDSGLRGAAAGRALPDDLRAPGRAAARGFPRRGARADAALHRRARDVRAAASRTLAVDAPPLARPAARRGRAGHVPGRRRARNDAAGRGAHAQLAGRHRDGAAGDRRGARRAPRRASFPRGAGRVRPVLCRRPRRRRRRAARRLPASAPSRGTRARSPAAASTSRSCSPTRSPAPWPRPAPASASGGATGATGAAAC